ncbi:hypothetical protein J4447_03015 [Candidatus Pacearchaeota archaeon]|nr:hypothetical protein [Candidatus Pacearchaeota archaeon]
MIIDLSKYSPVGLSEKGWEEIKPPVFSNLDGILKEDIVDRLKEGECFSRHSAWDFNGSVYFNEGRFHEEVWVYCKLVEVLEGDTAMDVINQAREKYGQA